MESVLNFLDSLDLKNKTLVVACSGGSDSMFLLDLLHKESYKVVCAHVNHKVRKESDDEYIFVSNYCKENDIPFEGTSLTEYTSGNFENFARNFRYTFFESVLKKYKTDILFTAHHGDDLIETIMMRLVRGSSLKGYKGFSRVTRRNDYTIIRPLIYLTKDDIQSMMDENNIKYVVDASNFTDDYTRNRFRHYLLPILKEEDKFVHKRFIQFSEELDSVYNFLNRVTLDCIREIYVDNSLDINKFNNIDSYLKRSVLVRILSELYPDNLYLVDNNHINEIMKIINSDKKNIKLQLPNNILVKKEYDKIIFNASSEEEVSYDYPLTDGLEVGEYIFKFHETDNKSNYVIRLNSKDVCLPLRVRTRLPSDKMRIKNLNGSKKINDIFIDNKVVMSKRESWPVVVDANNQILWLPGLKKSDFDIPNGSCYDIIVEYLKKGEKDL